MSDLTCNGRAVLRARITEPRVGMWVMDLDVDGDEAVTGSVTVEAADAGVAWVGAVLRGAVDEGRWRGRIVGGSGGLWRPVPARAFRDAVLSDVARITLYEAGEQIDGDADALTAAAPWWLRAEQAAALTIADVARAAGLSWRVTRAGTVWIGSETWPTATLGADVVVSSIDPHTGRVTLGSDAWGVLPGTTVTLPDLGDTRIGLVETRLEGDVLTTVLTTEPTESPAGRLAEAFDNAVRRVTRRYDRAGLYPCTVVAQRADGSLDLVPDDPTLPSCAGVPYRSLPGVAVEVPAGARVLLGCEGMDPRRPVATLWEPDELTRLVVAGGEHPAARQGHAVEVTLPMGALIPALAPGGPLPAAPLTLTGTITGGTDVLRLP